MSKDMLSIAVRKLVSLPTQVLGIVCDLLEKLSDPEWVEATKRFLCKENPWQKIEKTKLLKSLGTIVIFMTAEKFVARDKFEVDISDDAAVKIYYVSDDFTNWFGDKVEDPMSKTSISYNELKKYSDDGPIIEELGGEEKVETSLTEIYYLMLQQGHGQKGILNKYANIFYVRDIKGVLRAVYVSWGVGAWYIRAYSFESEGMWYEGSQVFSRNSGN